MKRYLKKHRFTIAYALTMVVCFTVIAFNLLPASDGDHHYAASAAKGKTSPEYVVDKVVKDYFTWGETELRKDGSKVVVVFHVPACMEEINDDNDQEAMAGFMYHAKKAIDYAEYVLHYEGFDDVELELAYELQL